MWGVKEGEMAHLLTLQLWAGMYGKSVLNILYSCLAIPYKTYLS